MEASFDNQDTPAARLADAVGRREIADAVGVGLTAVSNAVKRGSFPPAWFFAVKAVCDAKGMACPAEAFKWKREAAE
jgi:hypothetical protein